MQGLATDRLEPGPELVNHIDQCLACRACEVVCPADVPYGQILDAGRALLAARSPQRRTPLYRSLLRRPHLAGWLAALATRTGLARLGAAIRGPLGRGISLLPRRARPFRSPGTAGTGRRGEVLLFTGCVGQALDGATLDDAVRVLVAAGWRVRVPRAQRCCGAMDQHGGRPAEAAGLAAANLGAFEGGAPIATCATGCAATLGEYARLAPEGGDAFASRVRDVAELVADSDLPLGSVPWRHVALHVPCTQRNVTGSQDATRRLLERIPGVEVRRLPAGCCGAAGEMFVTRPSVSDAVLEPLLDSVLAGPADVVVTSNIGCLMHIGAGLARRGRPIPVLHPVSVAARSLAGPSV